MFRPVVNQQTRGRTNHRRHPDHSRYWECSLLFCRHSLHMHAVFAFVCWSSFLEKEQTQNSEADVLNPGLLRNVSKGFSGVMFKPTSDLVQFLFRGHSVFSFNSFCLVMFLFVQICLTVVFLGGGGDYNIVKSLPKFPPCLWWH